MENFYLSAVISEMMPEVVGRSIARVSVVRSELLIDLRLPSGRVVVASLDKTAPALYLSSRAPKSDSGDKPAPHPFLALLRKHVAGAKVMKLSKPRLDRIVRMEFEKYGPAGDRVRSHLVLALTGRSSNAYLTDDAGNLSGQFFGGTGNPEPTGEAAADQPQSAARFLSEVDPQATEAELLEEFFGAESPFAPSLRSEFIFRSRESDPYTAIKSLADDLFDKPPAPAVYSRHPLGESGSRLVSLKSDLLLSIIELHQARDMIRQEFPAASEAADRYYLARDEARAFQSEYNVIRETLRQEVKKRQAILNALERDRSRFDDPEDLKRRGDLLLANLATAKVDGQRVRVVDYYDSQQREIEIEIGENVSLQQAASNYFSRYQKARRALASISERRDKVSREVDPLGELLLRLERDPTRDNVEQITRQFGRLVKRPVKSQAQARSDRAAGAGAAKEFGRRFISSDGFEILVGRNDRDNDHLTFRAARPQDLWLHAADYPGSHVVVRNPGRAELPHRTLIEAAQLAAFYSQAKRDSKAAVHYTQRKFVSKPPRSKPGLVRLSSFKTILVEPRADVEKLN